MSDEGAAADLQWAEAKRWFAIAERDMRTARHCLAARPPLMESSAFSCQQAGEKLLKGLLVAAAKSFPKTHDLKHLGNRVMALHPHLRVETAIAPPAPAEIEAAPAYLEAFCKDIQLLKGRKNDCL